MERSMKTIYSLALVVALGVVGIIASSERAPKIAHAQMCEPGDTTGNLEGYATTTHLGNIYMSTESWNAANPSSPTSVNFSVSYNRQTERWSGRGWNPIAGWVDFGQTDPNLTLQKNARFEMILADPAGWGYKPDLIDLANVTYQTDPGGFVGLGTHGGFTMATIPYDDPVGAKYVDFSNVTLLVNPNCHESVDVLLNGVNVLYSPQCPISSPTIQWSTTDVQNCVATQGLWSGPKGNAGTEISSGSITTSNSPVLYRLTCEGIGSGSTVYGDAIANCGQITVDPDFCAENPGHPDCIYIIDPTEGVPIPDFREV